MFYLKLGFNVELFFNNYKKLVLFFIVLFKLNELLYDWFFVVNFLL